MLLAAKSRTRASFALSSSLGALLLLSAIATPSFASRILWQRTFSYLSWATGVDRAGDFNGDGLGDFLFAVAEVDPASSPTPTLGWIHVMLGAPYQAPFQELVFVGGQSGAKLGGAAAHAGDLDGDGFDDIVASRLNGQQMQIVVFRGSSLPDSSVDLVIPWLTFTSPPGAPPIVLQGVGDVNADGYDDFAVGIPDNPALNPNCGRVSVFFGGAVLNGTPDLTLEGGAAGDRFGLEIAGERDFDSDGFSDLAVGAPGVNGPSTSDQGEVRYYKGGPSLDTVPDEIFHGTYTDQQFGSQVDFLADFDGDGCGDLVVGAHWSPKGVFVFRGGPSFDTVPDWQVTGQYGGRAGDDVNHDGISDVLVSFTHGSVPGSHVYFGGPILDTIPDTPLATWPSTWEVLPSGLAISAGDVNGDRYTEWLASNTDGGIHPGAILSLFTARPLVGAVDPSMVHDVAVTPSPARGMDVVTMTIPGLTNQTGGANDVSAQVLDVSGRVVDRLVVRGTGSDVFRWVPAQHTARSGIYFLRVRSNAASFDRMVKFVVVD